MMRRFTVIILFLSCVCCKVQNSNKSIFTEISQVKSDQYYFPLHQFPEVEYLNNYVDSSTMWVYTTYEQTNEKIDTIKTYARIIPNAYDTFRIQWYSVQLLALNEPILFNEQSEKEIYRFTWLRTFHNPIAIRIEKLNNDYHVYWKVCNGAGGYLPGNLIIDKEKIITKFDWDKFQDLLTGINYWNLTNIQKTFGDDGSQWILEGKASNKYHVIDVWSPNEKSKYYNCCDFLIELTDLEIETNNKY